MHKARVAVRIMPEDVVVMTFMSHTKVDPTTYSLIGVRLARALARR
jgi:hypothetical protein